MNKECKDVINKIKSGLGENREENIIYLMNQWNVYKDHRYSEEISNEIMNMLDEYISFDELIDMAEKASESINKKLNQASELINDEDYERAIDLLYEFLDECYMDLDDNDGIVEYYNYYTPLDYVLLNSSTYKEIMNPQIDYFNCYYSLGHAHSALEEYKEAEESFKLAIKFNPYVANPRFELADLYIKQDKLDEYKEVIDEAYNYIYKPEDLGKYYSYLGKYFDQKDQDDLSVALSLYGYHYSKDLETLLHNVEFERLFGDNVTLPEYEEIIQILDQNNIETFFNDNIVSTILSFDESIRFDANEDIIQSLKDADGFLEKFNKLVDFYKEFLEL